MQREYLLARMIHEPWTFVNHAPTVRTTCSRLALSKPYPAGFNFAPQVRTIHVSK